MFCHCCKSRGRFTAPLAVPLLFWEAELVGEVAIDVASLSGRACPRCCMADLSGYSLMARDCAKHVQVGCPYMRAISLQYRT